MKVIFLLPSLRVNGASVIFELANQLVNKGNDVKITCLDELIPIDFFPLIVAPIPINEALKHFDEADAVIAYYPVCAYYLNDVETRAKKFYLITEDQKIHYSKEVFKVNFPQLDADRLEIEYIKQQNYIEKSYTLPLEYLVTNDDLTKRFKDYYKRKVTTVPIGINTNLYYPELVFLKDESTPRILVEGNLMPWKGIKEVNEALSLIRGYQLWTLSDTKYTIKSDKHWQNLTAEAIRKLLSSCDILIRAYKEDGMAELQAQAMACGCTVLTRETSGSKMFCKDGVNCLTFTKDEELEDKIKTLLINKELRNKLISGGLETVKSLDWQKSILALEKVIGGKKYGRRTK